MFQLLQAKLNLHVYKFLYVLSGHIAPQISGYLYIFGFQFFFLVFLIKINPEKHLGHAKIKCYRHIFSCYKLYLYFIDWHLITFFFWRNLDFFLQNKLLTMFPCRRRQHISSTWVYTFLLKIDLLLDSYAGVCYSSELSLRLALYSLLLTSFESYQFW